MNDIEREAAAIARSVRRVLERARAAGTGELLARGAFAAHETNGGKGPAVETISSSALEIEEALNAAHAAQVREEEAEACDPPAVESFDLFGRPIPTAAVAEPPPVAPPERKPMRPGAGFIPLNPIDPATRATIAEGAKPVLAKIDVEVRKCEACALFRTRTKGVPGVGGALSGIVFVGEAPGAEEDKRGEPFVGRAGELLDKIIKAMDDARLIPGVRLSRETVFIGNVIHCRPPENRVPLPNEVENSSPFLTRQLEVLKPRIIVCLGKTAAEHLLGVKTSLGGMRGKIYRYQGAKMIVTYHPAACLRNPMYKRPVWEDMQLLAREYQMD